MNIKNIISACILSAIALGGYAQNSQNVVKDFLNNRFGVQINFNMATYGEKGEAQNFNPLFLACNQWAAAALSARMTYGVLSVKDSDGFTLWDSSVTEYDVAKSAFQGDIVKEYVEAFRAKGLGVGFSFSMLDTKQGIEAGSVSAEDIKFAKKQIYELLTSYGDITCIVLEGWGEGGLTPSFAEISLSEITAYINSIQPDCMVIVGGKNGKDMVQVTKNLTPTKFCKSGYEKLEFASADEILLELDKSNAKAVNYMLSVAPNAFGHLDDNTTRLLESVGNQWVKPAVIDNVAKARKGRNEGVNIPTNRFGRSAERDFNLNWKFSLNNEDPEAYFIEHDDSDWRGVNVPHDWSIEHGVDPVNGDGATAYLPGGLGWYRKSFVTPQKENQRAYIVFDGVYNNSEIWVNGKLAKTHPYGYSPFVVDVTDYMLPYERGGRYITNCTANAHVQAMYKKAMTTHENVIAVKVDRERYIDSRWYTGSGIYRNVRMVVVDNLHIPVWGTFVTTPVANQERAEINIAVEVENCYDEVKNAVLVTKIINPDGVEVASVSSDVKVGSWKTESVNQKVEIKNPDLWSIDTPQQYIARTILSSGGEELETYNTKFGVRSMRFDAAKGFFLNEVNTKIKGVCLHHDGGAVGAAVPIDIWRRRLEKLKEGGANAIRISHNPSADDLLDLCDEMGFLVQEEFFDEWDNPKDKRTNMGLIDEDFPTRSYTEHFGEWAQKDIETVVKRGRNHPSIFQWSIGNEIEWCYLNSILASGLFSKDQKLNWFYNAPAYDQDKINEIYHSLIPATYDQAKTARKLARWTRDFDTTRFVTANYIVPSASMESGAIECLDVAGFSYRSSLYDRARERMPDMPIMGTETRPSWLDWKAALERDCIAGIFIWTGVDYLGEANNRGPFPKMSTVSGMLDLTGKEKPTFYYMQSMWSDKPMVHIYSWEEKVADYKYENGEFVARNPKMLPASASPNIALLNHGWNYPLGEEVIIEVYTNCDEVDLCLNGKSLGRKKADDFIADKRMKWFVPFSAGKLEARAYKNGKLAAVHNIETVGEVAAVRLELDRVAMAANGTDVVHCVAQLVDAKGREILDDNNTEIEFIIDGNCTLLGVDNGCQENINPFQTTKVKAYHGSATFLLQSKREAGTVNIKAVTYNGESKTQVIRIIK